MKRFQTGLAAALCCGALSLLAGCDDGDHHGFFPPPPPPSKLDTAAPPALIPGARTRYLAEIAQGGRAEKTHIERSALAASRAYGLY